MTERLLIIIASIMLMFALLFSLSFVVYLVKLYCYLKDTNNTLLRPIYKTVNGYWLSIMWALFYLFHHLVRYLN